MLNYGNLWRINCLTKLQVNEFNKFQIYEKISSIKFKYTMCMGSVKEFF
jgi:hypothetical protein